MEILLSLLNKIVRFMKILAPTLLFLLVIACNQKKETEKIEVDNLNLYKEYITEVSHGIISSKAEVRVVLNQPVLSWEAGQELERGVIAVFPETKGKVVVMDSRTPGLYTRKQL